MTDQEFIDECSRFWDLCGNPEFWLPNSESWRDRAVKTLIGSFVNGEPSVARADRLWAVMLNYTMRAGYLDKSASLPPVACM